MLTILLVIGAIVCLVGYFYARSTRKASSSR
jgi:hypothetical protein